MREALFSASCIGATICLFFALRAYRIATLQAHKPRLEKGKGGLFQQINELRFRQDTNRYLRRAVMLMIVASITYLIK